MSRGNRLVTFLSQPTDGCLLSADEELGGNLEFPAMRRLSISTAHAFLLVYSVDDRASFDEVRRLWEQIKEERTGYTELPCVVAGNKVQYVGQPQSYDPGDDLVARGESWKQGVTSVRPIGCFRSIF